LNTYERIFVRGDAQDDKITHNVIFSPISFRRTKRNREKNPEKKKKKRKNKTYQLQSRSQSSTPAPAAAPG